MISPSETPHTSAAQQADNKLLERYRSSLTGVFGSPARTLVRGDGVQVWDADDHRYTDLLGGIAVNVLGHGHPKLVAAVTEQITTLGHISNFFTSVPQVQLAEKLLDLVGAGAQGTHGTVFFANSGTEANEAAFKLARRHGAEHGPNRNRIIAMDHGFHGRTMGALALSWKDQHKTPFAPLPDGVEHVAYGDLDAISEAIDETVAAVFIEPVQGESGVHATPPGYLEAVRELTRTHGALLIYDEVQSGVGRTGTWFGHQNPAVTGVDHPVVPDAMTVAKGLGGGMPIGALISFTPDISGLLTAGQHGTTFGGNPLATAAGLAVLEAIETESLLERITAVADQAATALDDLDVVSEVRAFGGLIGIDLDVEALSTAGRTIPENGLGPAVVAAALDAGWIINATGPHTLRLAPALIITGEELMPFVDQLTSFVLTATEPKAAQ